MRISKLELIGFKSFKDRTVIQFDKGITGIVGPNGCGKSNIVDALLWVMGEMSAKELRGSAMTDVIFAGAEGYSPLGMCEVSLTLENDGGPFPAKYIKHSELMVTRRLHRNGEGEYLINKEQARLKDVQEIFMDTGAGAKGFSIIQQGMIGKIITAKPEDRRHLIEEAAGITKFKARKKESQRKLISTDQNLVRLQDIIGELKRQIDSLQRQAQRAERYRNLKNQIEDLDLWLSSLQFNDLKTAALEAERIFNEAQSMEVEGEATLAGLQTEIETLKLSLLEQEKSIEKMQYEQESKREKAKQQELSLQELKFEIEQTRRHEVMTDSLLQEQKARHELLSKEKSELESELKALEEEAGALQAAFDEKNNNYSVVQARITQADDELTEKRQQLFAVGQGLSSLEAKSVALQSQIEEAQERLQAKNETLVELREKQTEYTERRQKIFKDLERERQMQLDLSSDVEAFEVNKKVLTEAVQEKKVEVETFKDHLNEVASLLYGLENLHQNFEGFEEGVKSVMLWQKSRWTEVTADGGVVEHFRPVSEVVEVPADYELAMEAALGSRMQTLLSTQSTHALEAVDYLKSSKSGRSSFVAQDFSRLTHQGVPQGPGVKALLKDVVIAQEQFQNTVQQMLDGVAVVDTIKTALELRSSHAGWTFVTPDGDVLSSDGVLTGGTTEGVESGLLKRRREIKELTEKKNEWGGKLALAKVALAKTESQLENVMNDFEGAQKRRLEQEIKVAELKKDLERAEHELASLTQVLEREQRELMQMESQGQQLAHKQEEIQIALESQREQKVELESLVQQLTLELQGLRAGFDQQQNEVADLRAQTASKQSELVGLQKQYEMVHKQVSELDMQLSRMSEESEQNTVKMSEAQIQLEEKKIEFERLTTEIDHLKTVFSQAKNSYEEMSADLRKKEETATATSRAHHERLSRMNEAQLKLEQAKMKEQYLVDQIRERYMLILPEVIARFEGREGDPALAEQELKELREKLSKIGEVNLSAIQEYDETAKRYEFLNQQHTDLTEAKEQLRKVIDRINRICSKRFKETFDLVNERFQKVFPVLFGGGEARLELHEDPEKGEMGIEIIAKPPGKKMQNVTLMSGGEKALTAVCLVFAIFLVKPSPYCLLDEVDAPLDDANVFRFNDLVREMAKRSQIICVTHNKHTMEVAGRLYGVTMQERGVSTMVSVNLSDL